MTEKKDPRPEWLINSRRVWTEDDARTCDRERIEEAWRRLFGEEAPKWMGDASADYDEGDTFYYLFTGGRIYVQSYEGNKIYLVNAAESAPSF